MLARSAALFPAGELDAKAVPWKELCELLNGVHEEVALFTTCFREVAKHVRLTYADVLGCVQESVAAKELHDNMRQQALHIARNRTPESYPDPEYAAIVLDELTSRACCA